MKRSVLPWMIGVFFLALGCKDQPAPYKDARLPLKDRIEDLLPRMTNEEKFWQLFMIPEDQDKIDSTRFYHGLFGMQVNGSPGDSAHSWSLVQRRNAIQRYFIQSSRLGIPVIFFDEALHGLARDKATIFPQSIGLAATFDPELMKEVATAIASEAKARGIRQVLSPVVNIATDVRWGRVEETYGEDPLLAARMGVAFVKPFEAMGIITTPKHFVANSGDGGRDSYPIHISNMALEETHLPPFRACITTGGARSIMASYNSFNGEAATASSFLLNQKLKLEMGFKGFVISDANAIGGSIVLHHTAENYVDAVQQAMNAGLDVIFQTEFDHHRLFIRPFLDGTIDQKRIDDAVTRVLIAKFELGLFDNPYLPEEQNLDESEHAKLAKRAALESIVLLKNDNNTLPFSMGVRSIAVIGSDAVESRTGGYSGPGHGKRSIFRGIKEKAANAKVVYVPGVPRRNLTWVVIPTQHLTSDSRPGLKGEYFNNLTLEGQPVLVRQDAKVDFLWTFNRPGKGVNKDYYSARWNGKISAPITGKVRIGLIGHDGYRLFLDNRLVIDHWRNREHSEYFADFSMVKGKKYDVRIEFCEPVGNGLLKLVWNVGTGVDINRRIQEAVAAAKKVDRVIIVAGLEEGEFRDRAMLSLPGSQEELIRKVAAVGRPVVVVIVGGSAVTMTTWIRDVNAVVDVWYPGQAGGDALADILFGDYNPAGRLPITFPLHEGQLPLVYQHKPTGRGDDYDNLTGLPLFPFGYGLSYSHFDYSNIRVDKKKFAAGDSCRLTFTLKNTDFRSGEEVIQLYFRDALGSVSRPVMELKAFKRVMMKSGESKDITFMLTPEMFSMLNSKLEKVIEPGDFQIMIGSTSRDIRLKEILTVISPSL